MINIDILTTINMAMKFKKSYIIVVVLITILNIILGLSYIHVRRYDKTNLINKNIKSVVELKAVKDENESYGTASLISDEGYFITNAHVVTYISHGEIYEFDNYYIRFSNEEEFIEVDLKKLDVDNDLALLNLNSSDIKSIKPLKINTKQLNLGEDVYSIGNGLNHGLSVSVGVVSIPLIIMNYKDVVREVIQLDITINDGNSGGPVFNIKGNLIGIISFRIRDNNGQVVYGVAYAIPSSVIKEFIKKT